MTQQLGHSVMCCSSLARTSPRSSAWLVRPSVTPRGSSSRKARSLIGFSESTTYLVFRLLSPRVGRLPWFLENPGSIQLAVSVCRTFRLGLGSSGCTIRFRSFVAGTISITESPLWAATRFFEGIPPPFSSVRMFGRQTRSFEPVRSSFIPSTSEPRLSWIWVTLSPQGHRPAYSLPWASARGFCSLSSIGRYFEQTSDFLSSKFRECRRCRSWPSLGKPSTDYSESDDSIQMRYPPEAAPIDVARVTCVTQNASQNASLD